MSLKVALGAATALYCVIGMGARSAVHAGLTTAPSLSVSERYTDNLYFSRTDPIGDLATMVAPRVDLRLDERAISGDVRYQATGEWYRQRRDQNRWLQQGEVDIGLTFLERTFPGLDIRLGGSLSRGAELPGRPLGDRPSELEDGVRLPPTETSQRRGTVSAGYPWTRRFESRFVYGYRATQYDAGTPALTVSTHDSTAHDASLSLRYRYSPLLTLSLNPGWNATRVDPVPGGPPETDTRATSRLSVGADYVAGPGLTLGGRIGAMVIEDDQRHLTVDAAVTHHLRTGLLALVLRQGAGTGGGVTRTVSLTQGASVTAVTTFATRMTATVGLVFSRNVSIPDQSLTPATRVSTCEASAGVSRRWLGWLSGRMEYSYVTQRARGVELDARRHLVTVSLTAQAPRWPLLR